MQYSDLSSLHAKTSLLGFGAMRLPLLPSGKATDIDIDAVSKMVDIAIDGGVNYFDTAPSYNSGASELALGKALVARHDRSKYYIATKLSVFICKTQQDIADMFEGSFKRLGTDYIDFFLIHALTETRYAQCKELGGFELAKRARAEGRIKRLGFSFHGTPEMLRRVLDDHDEFEFIQLQLNYLDWDPLRVKEQYEIAREHGLPVFVMEPVKGGSLANLVPAAAALSPQLATPAGQAAFALRYVASLPGVATVLSGMSTLEQVKTNVAAFNSTDMRTFGDADKKLVEDVLVEMRKISQVPCTSCAYCVEGCPVGIEIPKIFSIYNDAKRVGLSRQLQVFYAAINEGHRADSCIKCGTCVDRCPQHIDIPTELEAIVPELPLVDLVPTGEAS